MRSLNTLSGVFFGTAAIVQGTILAWIKVFVIHRVDMKFRHAPAADFAIAIQFSFVFAIYGSVLYAMWAFYRQLDDKPNCSKSALASIAAGLWYLALIYALNWSPVPVVLCLFILLCPAGLSELLIRIGRIGQRRLLFVTISLEVLLVCISLGIWDRRWYPSLHDAAGAGNLSEVKAYLESNPALVHARDYAGRTPLFDAITGGNEEIVRFLLARGASPLARDLQGNSPVDWAEFVGSKAMVTLLTEGK